MSKRKRSEENSVVEGSKYTEMKTDTLAAESQSGSRSFNAPNIHDEAHSYNILKLETDELLNEVKIDFTRSSQVEDLLWKVKRLIEEIPSSSSMKITDFVQLFEETNNVKVPFGSPKPLKETLYTFAYEKPTRISVIGSFLLQTMTKHPSGLVIDLAVVMPKTLFQVKDYQDYRYFHKRACYLSVIASELQKKARSLDVSLSFEAWHGNRQKPILHVCPTNKMNKPSISIRIIPVLSKDVFVAKKLNSTRCNIRHLQSNTSGKLPTLRYNASILADMLTQENLEFLHVQQKLCPEFKNACILGRIWLEQRKFSGTFFQGGFGVFEWSMLLAFLLQGGGPQGGKLLANGYTCLQLFKGALQYIATHDLLKQPIKFGVGESAVIVDCPVLEDETSGLNYLYKMTKSSYLQLKFEAKLATLALQTNSATSFEPLFLREIPHDSLRYDLFFRLSVGVTSNDIMDPTLAVAGEIDRVVRKTLSDRVVLVSVCISGIPSWNLDKVTPMYDTVNVDVGLVLNHETCDRIVARGPFADDKEASEEFRDFWGDKADLRRFQDGSIQESVVAHSKPSKLYPFIVEEFLDHTLKRHFGGKVSMSSEALGKTVASSLDYAIEYRPAMNILASTTDSFLPIFAAYDDICNDIKGLEDLPLRVSSIMGSSPVLRYSSTQIPIPHPQMYAPNLPESCKYLQPIDFILQLESSSKWPDDLEAMKRVKVAFLLDISRRLQSQKSISSRVCVQMSPFGREYPVLEIYHSTGYVFRTQLYHDREATLYRRKITQLTALKDPCHHYNDLLSDYNQTFIAAPRHTLQIQALCQRYPHLSPAIRLVKRWLHSHMLSPHIDDESIELLVTSVFTNSFPFHVPSSAFTGFLRTLRLLASWDWRLDPVIVTMDPIGENERDKITQNFKRIRDQDSKFSHYAWFIGTVHEPYSIFQTKDRPSHVIATRITYLANVSLQTLLQSSPIQSRSTFITPLKHFDFLIHLNSALNPRSHQGLPWKFSKDDVVKPVKVYKSVVQTSLPFPKVDFDIVTELVKEIHATYSGVLLLFFDEFGGNVIAGLWTPKAKLQQTWKVHQGFSTLPIESEGKAGSVVLNKEAILAEIENLGGSLIIKIEVMSPISPP